MASDSVRAAQGSGISSSNWMSPSTSLARGHRLIRPVEETRQLGADGTDIVADWRAATACSPLMRYGCCARGFSARPLKAGLSGWRLAGLPVTAGASA